MPKDKKDDVREERQEERKDEQGNNETKSKAENKRHKHAHKRREKRSASASTCGLLIRSFRTPHRLTAKRKCFVVRHACFFRLGLGRLFLFLLLLVFRVFLFLLQAPPPQVFPPPPPQGRQIRQEETQKGKKVFEASPPPPPPHLGGRCRLQAALQPGAAFTGLSEGVEIGVSCVFTRLLPFTVHNFLLPIRLLHAAARSSLCTTAASLHLFSLSLHLQFINHDKDDQSGSSSDEGDAGGALGGPPVRRSAVSGRKIRMHIHKTVEEKARELQLQKVRMFLNSAYD